MSHRVVLCRLMNRAFLIDPTERHGRQKVNSSYRLVYPKKPKIVFVQ